MSMPYVEFGKTGLKVSRLGFGAMRLPIKKRDDCSWEGEDEAAEIIRRGFELGINYIDSAYAYTHSENVVGKALKGWRDKVYVASKIPVWNSCGDCWRHALDVQLQRLETDYIDFLLFHGLTWSAYRSRLTNEKGPLQAAMKAKEEGLIRNISFSCHDSPEGAMKLIDTGEFASLLMQYNLLDRVNEEVVAHAAESGMGVVVMGPVGGGRLATASSVIPGAADASATARLALRFVLSNPNVHVAISGMGSMQMVEENVETASNVEPMSAAEKKDLDALFEKNKQLAGLPCTGCRYCLPCQQEVGIPEIFTAYNLERVYGLTETARKAYAELGKGWHEKHKPAGACIDCGECEPKCPQKIPIREKLKEAHEALATEK